MRGTVSWALALVILVLSLSAGCSENRPTAKPLNEEERKKIDEEMRKMTEKKQ